MDKSIWQLGIGAWLLSLVTVSVFLTVVLAAGFLVIQNRVQDRIVTGRGERDILVTTLEQRIAKLQAATHFGDHVYGAASATNYETWIGKTESRGQWR
jgi:hypothetical protein